MSTVDILTITYNQGPFIGRCIESVLSQTYNDWRLLIVDDGSNDRTCDIVNSYDDDRIFLIRADHRGIESLGASYALALGRSTSPLLAILDGDDWWPSHKLEMEVPTFKNSDVAMVFGAADIYDINGNFIKKETIPDFATGLRDGNDIIFKMLSSNYFTFSVTTMVRSSAIRALGGFIQPAALPLVDTPTWLNVLCGSKCLGISEVLGCYRVHDNSVCRQRSFEIDRGQMQYNELFLDSNWQRIGLSEDAWRKYRKQIRAYNNHRRGTLYMVENNWQKSIYTYKDAFNDGSIVQKSKTAFRAMQLILKIFYNNLT